MITFKIKNGKLYGEILSDKDIIKLMYIDDVKSEEIKKLLLEEVAEEFDNFVKKIKKDDSKN